MKGYYYDYNDSTCKKYKQYLYCNDYTILPGYVCRNNEYVLNDSGICYGTDECLYGY